MSTYWSCLLLIASWICFQTHSVSGACTSGTYGLDCNYTCHCNTRNCNDVTGCSDTCNKGWSGPKCNIQNIALGKVTMQSSYWRNSINSSRAVDGMMNTKFTENSCIHTGIWSSLEWWQVDLGRNIYIHKLAIYFRTDVKKRRKGVTVYSSVADKQTNTGHPCGTATLDSPDVTWMICNSTARYITLYRDTYGDKAMDFCEVQVFICDAGTFGDDCRYFCHCLNGPCNYVTGECSGGCKPNWSGQTCSECDSDHYGPLCGKPCSSRQCDESGGKSSCNKTTGRCDNGCTAGWKEHDCTKDNWGLLGNFRINNKDPSKSGLS
ncbi:protein draper-like [Gigantopelta aegis]|uniref:protein draper-like n=1 Tax=Gigantopelta aegis TaxID=1735272 RepID=UPI001B88C12C|nr:protein draper-like [Gigantopelta aegis]